MQELRFLGAAGTVTGSKFLLSTPGGKVLVDCGMYQGDRAHRAGHILGSSILELVVGDRTVVFSGDLTRDMRNEVNIMLLTRRGSTLAVPGLTEPSWLPFLRPMMRLEKYRQDDKFVVRASRATLPVPARPRKEAT